ncbi:DUF6603 domain-containing protein [Streptomyces noursei]|uniref:DUF6603 domain-containing protein n=1 Tax=Streptomyces noursei TaxID=1971 RepID=UPI0033ED24FF
MDIATLKGIVNKQLESNPFTISGEKLGNSAPVIKVLKAFLGVDSLTITGAGKEETPSDITVSGKLTDKLAGAVAPSVRVTFSIKDGAVRISLKTGTMRSWEPADGFPKLKNSALDGFTFSDVELTLDSAAPALPETFPADLGYPAYDTELRAKLVPGLSISASVWPKKDDKLLTWMLGTAPWKMSGPVVLPADYPSVQLTSPPGTGIQLGGVTVAYALNAANVALVAPAPADPVPASCLVLAGRLTTPVKTGSVTVPFTVRHVGDGSGPVTVESRAPDGTGITVTQVASLLGITDETKLSSLFPQDFPALADVYLDGVCLQIDPGSKKLLSASATVTWKPAVKYQVLSGLVTFSSLAVAFTYLPAPLGRAPGVSAQVTATATIGGGTLTATLDPAGRTFRCELDSGKPADLTALVKSSDPASLPLPTAQASYALVSGDFSKGTYQVQAAVTDWKLTRFATADVVIKDVGFVMTKGAGGLSGEIFGELKIGDITLSGSAAYDGTQRKAWIFRLGASGTSISLTKLAGEAAKLFSFPVPPSLPDLTLTDIGVEFNTATGDFVFRCSTSLALPSGTADLGVEITKTSCTGLLWIGEQYFELDLTKQQSGMSFTAAWKVTDLEKALRLSTIVNAFSEDAPQLPALFDVGLTSAKVTYDAKTHAVAVAATSDNGDLAFATLPKQTTPNQLAAAQVLVATVRMDAGLSDLPVLGPQVPPDLDLRLVGTRVVAASRTVADGADAQRINDLLKKVTTNPALLLPTTGLTAKTGLALAVTVNKQNLLLGAPEGAGPQALERPSPQGLAAQPIALAEGAPGTLWHQLNLALGPVHVDRLGVRYARGTVWLLVDAGLDLGGLQLSGRGLGLGVPLDRPREFTAGLEGLGLAWKRPPIELSGAFVNETTSGYLVKADGGAVLKAPTLSISAIGGYAQRVNAQPSLFLFGQLGFPAGQGVGPPPFRVTGAAAGFGYNSSVRLPDISEIDTFPLMPSEAGSGGTDAMALVDSLTKPSGGGKPWVTEAPGRVWLAAGLRFDSFQFIHARALALGEFDLYGGSGFSLALLGQADADFPPRATGAARYAHVSLALIASYTSTENALRVRARIQPGSYLVHPSCKLSGDAAFTLWFGPEHAGDFVLTVGGYHPKFQAPAHYPAADRLRIEWDAGPVSLRGACYAALTPSAFMVGAQLDVSFHEGPIHAWCRAVLDALIQWDPFQFRVTLSVRIGVRIDIVVPISAEIGVDLDLWGPPTGGIAHVHVAFGWTFDIRFGEDPPSQPKYLGWNDFVSRMLPGPVAQVLVETGRLPAEPADGAAEQPDESCEMSRDGFTVLTRASIPAAEITLTAPGRAEDAGAGKSITIRPVNAAATSVHKVTITHDGAVIDPTEDPYGWTVTHITGKVPLGVWGAPFDSAGQAPPLPVPRTTSELTDGLTGTRITAPRRAPSGGTVKATDAAIAWEARTIDEPPLTSTGQSGTPPTESYDRTTLAAQLTGTDRKPLLDALVACGVAAPPGGSLTDSLAGYASHIHSYLRADPMARSSES